MNGKLRLGSVDNYGIGDCVKFISILCDVCWRVNQLLRLKHPKKGDSITPPPPSDEDI